MFVGKAKIQSLLVEIAVSIALILILPSSDSIYQRGAEAVLNTFLAEYVINLLQREDK
jgi:hypothetical protein